VDPATVQLTPPFVVLANLPLVVPAENPVLLLTKYRSFQEGPEIKPDAVSHVTPPFVVLVMLCEPVTVPAATPVDISKNHAAFRVVVVPVVPEGTPAL
jgi:hypothetical protein